MSECAICQATPCKCSGGPTSWQDHALALECDVSDLQSRIYTLTEDLALEKRVSATYLHQLVTIGEDSKVNEAMTEVKNASIEGEHSTEPPRSLAIASAGVKTGTEFASLMSALMSDVIQGRLSPQISNAAVNAGGKLLKMVEMEYKYGPRGGATPTAQPTLSLVGGE